MFALALLTKLQVLRLLQTQVPDAKSVSDILEDLGGGRRPVLYVTGGRDCIARKIDGNRVEHCSPTTVPHVAIIGPSGIEATLDLPLEAAPWDMPEEMQWGIHAVKDLDGDGKPELLLTYGYHGPMVWALGNTGYKHVAILNLDPLAVAFDALLEVTPQAVTAKFLQLGWKLLPAGKIRVGDKVYRHDAASGRWVLD